MHHAHSEGAQLLAVKAAARNTRIPEVRGGVFGLDEA